MNQLNRFTKSIITVACFLLLQGLSAQITLSSHHLELKKNSSYYEILTAANATNTQLAIIAADKETVTALNYNSAMFYTDSLSTTRPDSDYEFMAGYSYTNNNPTVYWADNDFKKIAAQHFNFETGIITQSLFEIPLDKERIVSTFSENDSFYLITLADKDDLLHFYIFNDTSFVTKTIDFSVFDFTDEAGEEITFNKLLKENPFQKIEVRSFNDLPSGGSTVKLYVLDDSFLITSDHNATFTQAFIIDIDSYVVVEKKYPQVLLSEASEAASFYNDGQLYQLKVNRDELALSSTDFTTGEPLKIYKATKDDIISFKNSPLLSQSGDSRTKEFKDTRRFLKRASSDMAALSVYKTPSATMVIAGGVREIMPTGTLIVGIALGGAMIATGTGYDPGMFMDGTEVQSAYFESYFDETFMHIPSDQGMLAIDYISEFTAHNKNLALQTATPFQDYYILGYYDAKAKLYIMQKFQDD